MGQINPYLRLVEIAKSYVGTTEVGGDNSGLQVEQFQKAVDGKAQKEPWCVGFVQYCVLKVIQECSALGLTQITSALPRTESALNLYSRVHQLQRSDSPKPGFIIVWQRYVDKKPVWTGHCGILTELVMPEEVETVEGNTGSGKGIIRDGDGVYLRLRSRHPTGELRVLGYVNPFEILDATTSPLPTDLASSSPSTSTETSGVEKFLETSPSPYCAEERGVADTWE